MAIIKKKKNINSKVKEDIEDTYIYGIYSTTKKNEILPLAATLIDLEGIMLSEIRQK